MNWLVAKAYDTSDTKLAVLDMLGSNPTLPYSIIANKVGLTRERVRQIARQNGYPPRRGVLKPKICPICRETYYTKNKYCSRSCLYESMRKRIVVNCHKCEKPMKRTPSSMHDQTEKYFCSRDCFSESRKKQIMEQRQDQILKAALEIFTRQGYAGATIKKIAAVAGVSVGTIYNYYTGKNELFIAVMKNLFITAPVLDVIDNMPKNDIRVSFKQILQNWFQVEETEAGPRIHYLISEIVRHPELKALWVEQLFQPICAKMERTYNFMIASGQLRHMSTPIAVRTMLGLVMGFGILNYLEDDNGPIKHIKQEEIFHTIADIAFHGIDLDAAEYQYLQENV